MRAFGIGTGAFAVWMDTEAHIVKVRHYDARMVVPLSWDLEGIRECAFVTRAFSKGGVIDQLQMHLVGDDGAYRIRTVCFAKDGRIVSVPRVADEVGTGSMGPTFGIVRPAVPNTPVCFSPYGQSVFADAVYAVQSVDLAYDALINEIDAGKMRVFLSDVMFNQQKNSNGNRIPIPFRKGNCTVFRKVMSTEDTITEFAPALHTEKPREKRSGSRCRCSATWWGSWSTTSTLTTWGMSRRPPRCRLTTRSSCATYRRTRTCCRGRSATSPGPSWHARATWALRCLTRAAWASYSMTASSRTPRARSSRTLLRSLQGS